MCGYEWEFYGAEQEVWLLLSWIMSPDNTDAKFILIIYEIPIWNFR